MQGFHIIAILENTSKYDISDLKEDSYSVVPLQQKLKKKKSFQKRLNYSNFFWSLVNFFKVSIKSNSW